MLTKVSGGTGAGCAMHRRRTIPKQQWQCAAGHANPWFANNCLHHQCREKRPT
jgi:hypothetical protein